MAGELLTKKNPMLVALESVKGTEVTADQPILAYDADMKFDGEFEQRMGTGIIMGNTQPGVINGRSGTCSFSVELRGTVAAGGMEVGLGILFQACGLEKTAEVYQVHSSLANQKTVTLDLYQDGKLKTLYGAMGTYTIEGESGGRIMINFEFTGLYKTPADVAVPGTFTPTASSPMQFQNGVFTIGGTAHPIGKFTLEAGNNVAPKQAIAGPGGILHYRITDYPDAAVGFDPEAQLIADHDFYGILIAGTEAALILTVGDGSTNITISCPAIQYKEIPDGDRDGIAIHELTAQCNHTTTASNDSTIITAAAA